MYLEVSFASHTCPSGQGNNGQLPLERKNLSCHRSMMSAGLNLRHKHFLWASPVTSDLSAVVLLTCGYSGQSD